MPLYHFFDIADDALFRIHDEDPVLDLKQLPLQIEQRPAAA